MPDKSLRQALIHIMYNKLNAKDWRQEQKHSSDDRFTCNSESITDTSMAELSERKILDNELLSILINFPESKFKNHSVVVVIKNENEQNPVNLDCVENKASLEKWLEYNFH